MSRKLGFAGAVLALVVALGVGPDPGGAADHIDAPLARNDLALDIGDVFIEQAPDDASQTLLVMTANTAQAPGGNRPWATRQEGTYRINIDRNGNGRRNAGIEVTFGSVRDNGTQSVQVRLNNRLIGRGSTGEEIALRGGGRAMVDVFDDPFFIDFQAVLDDLEQMGGPRQFCDGNEIDFLAGLNTGAIVIQIPSRQLTGNPNRTEIGVWVDTYSRDLDRVVDRMGQPEVPTFFIEDNAPGLITGLGIRDKYNGGEPADDLQSFGDEIAEKLIEFSGRDDTPYSEEQAITLVTEDVLPDILRFDVASSDGIFDGNGRKVLDDGLDFALARATGGSLGGSAADPTDCIDANDRELSQTFPYLATAHQPADNGSNG